MPRIAALPAPVRDLVEVAGGTVQEVGGPLPDGSGFAVASFPLPAGHWLRAEGFDVPPMPFRMGTDDPRRAEWVTKIRTAARYAVRAATMNGADLDFDPDALVQNSVIGLLGYYTPSGLSSSAPDGKEHAW